MTSKAENLTGFDMLYQAGISGLAERYQISIPEAAVIGLSQLVAKGKNLYIPNVVTAIESLNPGPLYIDGLWRFSGATARLRESAVKMIKDMKEGHADEHIEPTKRAFTWHTGQEL